MTRFVALRFENGVPHTEVVEALDAAAAEVICSLRGWHFKGELHPLPAGHRVIGVIPKEKREAMTEADIHAAIALYQERANCTVH